MDIFGKILPFFLLSLDEWPKFRHVLVKNLPKLFPPYHFYKCLFVCLWHLCWLFQVAKVFVLPLNIITHCFHVFVCSNFWQYLRWLPLLPRFKSLKSKLLLESGDVLKHQFNSSNMIQRLHQKPVVSALLRHQAQQVHLIDFVCYLEFVEVRMEWPQIVVNRKHEVQKLLLLVTSNFLIELDP